MKFNETDLQQMMRTAADEPDLQFPNDWLDKEFHEMEFDSLSVLELATLVQRQYGIAMSDEVVDELTTPRGFYEYVQGHLTEES